MNANHTIHTNNNNNTTTTTIIIITTTTTTTINTNVNISRLGVRKAAARPEGAGAEREVPAHLGLAPQLPGAGSCDYRH